MLRKIYTDTHMRPRSRLLIYRWWRSMLSFRYYACWWNSQIVIRWRKKHSHISRHSRAAPSLPTKTKLLSFTYLDHRPNSILISFVVLDSWMGRIWLKFIGFSFLTCSRHSTHCSDYVNCVCFSNAMTHDLSADFCLPASKWLCLALWCAKNNTKNIKVAQRQLLSAIDC